jgi:eukaryotic-like serine/threonine-protein kinase
MGIVYEAFDVVHGREVALKVMTPPRSSTPDSHKRHLERFLREAQALSRLAHPQVARIIDQGQISGRQYFSMELIRGTTLKERIQLQGPLSLPDLTRLAIELCDVLEHLHGRGVIHRDIKPDNIMLLPDGRAVLMDFGVAQLRDDTDPNVVGGFHGSPAYMSPEQVAGRAVDGRSDIYSLAVTLYQAATGRRAVEGESVPEILRKVMEEYPAPPAGLPFFFQAILMKAMAKSPAVRYQRAGDLAMDLSFGRAPSVPGAMPASEPSPVVLLHSPLAAPPDVGAAPAGPVFLGEPDPEPGPAATLGAWDLPPPGGSWLGETARVPEPSPAAEAAPAAARAVCRVHPALAGVAKCGICASPICYTCTLEVPGRGVLCRACAFGGRP